MFGKNYDEEIKQLIDVNNNNVKNINDLIKSNNSLQELFSSLQDNLIKFAKIQAQHKSMITFLINHASVDEDSQEDLSKMMQEISKLEKEIK
jgi:superfamily I DNA and RNA helicase